MRLPTLLFVAALSACGGSSDAPPAVAEISADVTKAIAVSNAIEANPTAIDSVLAAHSLTRPGLDSLLFRIAEDSTMSAQYEAGRRPQ